MQEDSLLRIDYLKTIPASYTPLTFAELKIYYHEKGFTLNNETFENNLVLKNQDGKYNRLAELLADKNHIGFIYARFKGLDKSAFSETTDFGNQCLITAVNRLVDRLDAENFGIFKTQGMKRTYKKLVNMDVLNNVNLESS